MKNKHFKVIGLIAICFMLIFTAACSSGNNNEEEASTTPAASNNSSGSNNSSSTDAPAEMVELMFWSLGENGYEELAEQWNSENPNIQVSIQNTGDQTLHHNNLTTALSANSGAPDIFMLEIAFMERFLEATDKFQNLNDFGAQDIESNYLDWKWQQATSVDGDFQIGLPTDIGPTVAFYRTDVVEEGGLPSDPEGFGEAINTWDKFAQVAKKFNEDTGKHFVDITDLLYNALRDQSSDEIYFSKEDGSFIGDQNPQVRKAFDFTVKGIQEGWVHNAAMWSAEWGEASAGGDFAVMLAPAWMSGVIKGHGDEGSGKWQITQLPEGAGNWGGSFLTLPKEGEHPEEAYAFISWLTNQENQLKSFETNGLMPSIPALYTDEAFTSYTDEFFSNQQIAVEYGKAANRVKPVYYGPLHDATNTFFNDALRNIIDSGADPQEEWENAVNQAKQLARRGG